MESIASILQKQLTIKPVSKPRSQRDVIIGELFEEVDREDRKNLFYIDKNGVKKKKRLYTIKTFAVKMSPHSVEELYYLKSTCNDARNRGKSYIKCLFGSIKIKPC